MSVSLQEVLESAGFDIKNNKDDALWLLGQQSDFEELCEQAEEVIDKSNEEEMEDECY